MFYLFVTHYMKIYYKRATYSTFVFYMATLYSKILAILFLSFTSFSILIFPFCQSKKLSIPFNFSNSNNSSLPGLLLLLPAPSSSPFSVRVPHWSHILECLRGAGGQRRPGPNRWCGCRRRWIWSIRCSSRSQRWSRASREPLVVHHTVLKDTQRVREGQETT